MKSVQSGDAAWKCSSCQMFDTGGILSKGSGNHVATAQPLPCKENFPSYELINH